MIPTSGTSAYIMSHLRCHHCHQSYPRWSRESNRYRKIQQSFAFPFQQQFLTDKQKKTKKLEGQIPHIETLVKVKLNPWSRPVSRIQCKKKCLETETRSCQSCCQTFYLSRGKIHCLLFKGWFYFCLKYKDTETVPLLWAKKRDT